MNILTEPGIPTASDLETILTADTCAAVSGLNGEITTAVWQALGNALRDNPTGYFLVIALDEYRRRAFTSSKEGRLSSFEASVQRGVRITTSHQIDMAYMEYAGSGRLTQLREMFSRCLGILVFLSDHDLGSTALAHWEWIQACVIGSHPAVYYILLSLHMPQRMTTWLDKHGVKSLHIFATPSSRAHDAPKDDRAAGVPKPKLSFTTPTRCRSLDADTLVFHHQTHSLRSVAESIHRRGGRTRAYDVAECIFGQTGERGTAFCCNPEMDPLPKACWHHAAALPPSSGAAWKTATGTVCADTLSIICDTPESLLASFAMLSSDADADDADMLAPGHLSRTCVGTYLLYTRLYFGLPLPRPLSPELGHFVPTLVEGTLSYWKTRGITDNLSSGGYGLTPQGAALFPSAQELLRCGSQWLHANRLLGVLPDQTPLGFVHELLTRWMGRGTIRLGHAYFMAACHEYTDVGTIVLRACDHDVPSNWIDETDALLSYDEARLIRETLLAETPDFSHIEANQKTKQCLLGLMESNACTASPAASIVECFDTGIKWWTFGGARLNAILCASLQGDPAIRACAFGNCAISMTLASENGNTPSAQHVEAILRHRLSMLASADDETVAGLAQRWFWPLSAGRWLDLLGPRWRHGYIRHILSKLQPRLQAMQPPHCLTVDAPHRLMEKDTLPHDHDDHTDITPSATQPRHAASPESIAEIAASPEPRPAPKKERVYYRLERGDGTTLHTRLPWSMIRDDTSLRHAIDHILQEPFVGLDVETTLFDHRLCLVQIGCHDRTFLIDPFCVDVHALGIIFSNPNIIKVIHNKSFECSVLGKLGLPIHNIVDTLQVSRALHPHEKSHKLMSVCLREFHYAMDKTHQQSRWEKRPLSADQLEYAALDAEIMIHLYCHFFGFPK